LTKNIKKKKIKRPTHKTQVNPRTETFPQTPNFHKQTVDLTLSCSTNQAELTKAKPISKVQIFEPTHHTDNHFGNEISHLSFPSSNQTQKTK